MLLDTTDSCLSAIGLEIEIKD